HQQRARLLGDFLLLRSLWTGAWSIVLLFSAFSSPFRLCIFPRSRPTPVEDRWPATIVFFFYRIIYPRFHHIDRVSIGNNNASAKKGTKQDRAVVMAAEKKRSLVDAKRG